MLLPRAGFDVMSVATNHIKDCGLNKSWCNEAFFDTLENLQRVGILTVGAGKNLEEALQPVVVTINGVRFGFVSLGDSKQDMEPVRRRRSARHRPPERREYAVGGSAGEAISRCGHRHAALGLGG